MGFTASDLDKKLLDLYTVACAPLSGDTLLTDLADLDPEDFTVSAAIDELSFLQDFATIGFKTITEAWSTIPRDILSDQGSDGIENSVSVSTALLSTASFAKRLSDLSRSFHIMCMNAVDRLPTDSSRLIKQLEMRVKEGERPVGAEAQLMQTCLNFTTNARWGIMEVPSKNKVGFKETAAVISEGKVQEESLKVSEAGRRKQRNLTGFHRFNFKDLGIGDSDIDSESRRSRASSVRGGSTDGGSTRGSASFGGVCGAMTSRSASSGGEELDDDKVVERSNSTVNFSYDKQIIEDPSADPDWEEQQRHQRRFSRIRNRVPTGHPSLMRGPSEELSGIVNDYEKTVSALYLDDKTAANTEANKLVQSHPMDDVEAAVAKATSFTIPGTRRIVTIQTDNV